MSNLEIEAKFIRIDPISIRVRLEKAGFKLVYPEFMMHRATFICNDDNMTLRIRKEYGKITMTYKYTDLSKWALGTEEIEIIVDNFDNAVSLLEKAHKPIKILYQESKRELWKLGETEVSLDEWPGTGVFVEIESPTEEDLISTTEKLWLDYKDALFGRSGEIYKALGYDVDYIHNLENLTFLNPPKK